MSDLFYINGIEIEEPQGFSSIVLNLQRDDNWHGIFSEASTSELRFYGNAYDILKEIKQTQGLKADVTFTALKACGGVYDEQEEVLSGKLDFRTYTESCGETCTIGLSVQQTGCAITLRNRYDQKVDMTSNVAFDGMTGLQAYDGLNYELELPAKSLDARVEGSVSESGDSTDFDIELPDGETVLTFRPSYENEVFNSINTGQLIPNSGQGWWDKTRDITYFNLTPQLLFDDNISCFNGNLSYTFRLKGNYSAQANDSLLQHSKLKVVTWNGEGNIYTDGIVVSENTLATNVDLFPGTNLIFDQTYNGTFIATDGLGYYAYLELQILSASAPNTLDLTVIFDTESTVDITTVKSCPPTTADVNFINETLARVTEAITNRCLTVKSNYYGRADSQPYASDMDGCGGLRVLTNGLSIRKAEQATYFESLKNLFDGLKGIDNIGMGIEDNPFIPGSQWLRIEPVEYFYRDEEVLVLNAVPNVEFELDEGRHFSIIKTGYNKWEVESVNGLDEFNSTREYRTSLTAVNNPLDITSNLVTGSYPIELTRQQTFADTGAADTKFDNETFLICLDRISYGFKVEQDNIGSPANIFSPETSYNWRIRPFANLMRWFKSIANSYPNIDDSDNILYFSEGKGNYIAEGELIEGLYDPSCKLENGVKAENANLSKNDFVNISEAIPLYKPETAVFNYPLSVKEYNELKSNPYGYINFQCGTGDFIKGFIKSIKYSLTSGEAEFLLKLKW